MRAVSPLVSITLASSVLWTVDTKVHGHYVKGSVRRMGNTPAVLKWNR